MFETIIWATDGSETADDALPLAKDLALRDSGSLVIVHCKEFFAGKAGHYTVLADEEALADKIRRQVEALRSEGFDAEFRLIPGLPGETAQKVVKVADEVGADLIVVGTRGYGPAAGVLFGSVTQRLMHVAPCPVLVVPPAKRRHRHVERDRVSTTV